MLYHLSAERIECGVFNPRIPKHRIEGEDETFPRICFSDSIEACLTSMPNGIQIANNLIYLAWKNGVAPLLYLYSVDETSIQPGNLLSPEKVSEYVIDAESTHEHWVINQTVQCHESWVGIDAIDLQPAFLPNDGSILAVSYLKHHVFDEKPSNPPEEFFSELLSTRHLRLIDVLGGMDFERESWEKKKKEECKCESIYFVENQKKLENGCRVI